MIGLKEGINKRVLVNAFVYLYVSIFFFSNESLAYILLNSKELLLLQFSAKGES